MHLRKTSSLLTALFLAFFNTAWSAPLGNTSTPGAAPADSTATHLRRANGEPMPVNPEGLGISATSRPPADNAPTGGTSARGVSAFGEEGPLYVAVPSDQVREGVFTNQGCWVRIYDAPNYAGDGLTLVGPSKIFDMEGAFGANWDDKVGSLETGPAAAMTVYDDEAFRQAVAYFKPSQRIPEVSKRIGLFDEFGSLHIICAR